MGLVVAGRPYRRFTAKLDLMKGDEDTGGATEILAAAAQDDAMPMLARLTPGGTR